ncbi:MAG: FUSC family protein [Filimonas sp.]|nr:FUSC family protein [Filimonas sp.]
MDYAREFRKFANGQYLYTGVRITAGVIIPALILYQYDLLAMMMGIPLGALCVSLTDNPGPPHHRKNGIIASIIINFIVAVITGYSRGISWLIGLEVIIFGMFFSLIAVYGSRVNSIGLIALLVFIFNIDSRLASHNIWRDALFFTIGGVWYALLSLISYTLRPYRLIQQLMGECLIETADYLRAKAGFYEEHPNFDELTRALMKSQVQIQQHQNDLREMLFKTRRVVSESTTKGRILMLMFLDTVDLFERVMTSQQDYSKLHDEFDGKEILVQYKDMIMALGEELHEIGLSVQSGDPAKGRVDLDGLLEKTTRSFSALRKQYLNPDTIEGFIKLRQILYSIQDITERVKRLRNIATYDKHISKQYKREVDLEQFITHQDIDPKILADTLSLKSSYFRHAVRLTVALLVGYIVSLLYPLGHGYWILLTIATIIKPAFSISRKRNIERIAGTVIGGVIGFLSLYLIRDNAVLFAVMVVAMIISYSFLKLQYTVSVAFITVYVLVSFYFMSPGGDLTHVLKDRVIDTLIGSVIAFVVSFFVLPTWEHEQMGEYVSEALEANKKYFDIVAGAFTGAKTDTTAFKLARKEAFVALANISDNLQRMLSEPKDKRPKLRRYHQFVATSHMLTSHIAALSYYAQRNAAQYASTEFQPLVQQIDFQFTQAIEVFKEHEVAENIDVSSKLPINDRISQLLETRRREMEAGHDDEIISVRRTLSDMKTITDQFELISTMTIDQIRILQKIVAK